MQALSGVDRRVARFQQAQLTTAGALVSAATRTAMRTIRDRLVGGLMGLDGLHYQPMERCRHPGAAGHATDGPRLGV